jgi:hypothetical protein
MKIVIEGWVCAVERDERQKNKNTHCQPEEPSDFLLKMLPKKGFAFFAHKSNLIIFWTMSIR